MVGDPGIEPSMSHLGGVTVRCRTLQHVALTMGGQITSSATPVNIKIQSEWALLLPMRAGHAHKPTKTRGSADEKANMGCGKGTQ